MNRTIWTLLKILCLFVVFVILSVTFREFTTGSSLSFDLTHGGHGGGESGDIAIKSAWLLKEGHGKPSSTLGGGKPTPSLQASSAGGLSHEAVVVKTSTTTTTSASASISISAAASVNNVYENATTTTADLASTTSQANATATPEDEDDDEEKATFADLQRYVSAIRDPQDQTFDRLECPKPSGPRYDYLKAENITRHHSNHTPKFFFALDLYQCVELLPRLLGSIVETMRFLGPENCVLSIVEGRSTDGTWEVLNAVRKVVESTGARYYLSKNDADPLGEDDVRIPILAELRNQALKPLTDNPVSFSNDTTVLFFNDVVICMSDILELIHQRHFQGADMICAMDWTYMGPEPTFYDSWIARTIKGETFFKIPDDGSDSWHAALNLFWNDSVTSARYRDGKPFQVFSCWNGAAVFTARPLVEQQISFRVSWTNECFQGEPDLFCKDLWMAGFGKIAVVPTVNLEYSDEAGKKIKKAKGYVGRWTDDGKKLSVDDEKIIWQNEPPELVKCVPSGWSSQKWVKWNESVEDHPIGSSKEHFMGRKEHKSD